MSETGWKKWRGGECPVDPAVVVEVRFMGQPDTFECSARLIDWDHKRPRVDRVIAYRLSHRTTPHTTGREGE